ncbi:trypsin-like peptidase domain-containing protein [Couchioplanes caeruleus]|uniref:WD40 repeat domain-containing protein n=1 Tax=Couchioplanes caeruleus TaxID=56438 RepID=UPI0020C16832|nr:WD40 repeat domain-containing protein [Couchioplanes caeruleus]UQU63411.1 trypsin-like peptidase domain-containing protein [Couchioplanes caeruleus]
MTKAPADPWTVAVHATEADTTPLGAGVVIDRHQVLTCAHVLWAEGEVRDEVWIAFPKARGVGPLQRCRARLAHDGAASRQVDVALLELLAPAPPSVRPARLRCAAPHELSGNSWWAFGFPGGGPHGGSASGTVGDPLGYGLVQLDSSSAPGLKKGFSGGALWSYDYEAVVGLIVAEGDGNGHALTLYHADDQLPDLKLSVLAGWQAEDAGDAALAAWGWVLADDEEARRHWLPRARGVAVHGEGGSRFRGRATALRMIRTWLDVAAPPARPLIVTGSPGVGKSAVLGRIVTTADAAVHTALPPGDTAVTATVGSVSCAVHAKGKSALEVATEIARAAAVALPADPADLMPALRGRLSRRPARFNLVIDALDEAVSPGQTRKLIRDVVLPLTHELARLGVQVVVGTRRADDMGDLLTTFGPAAEIIDLDAPEYFAEADLADYALATLGGADRPGNPYADERVAVPVARRIAALSRGNFLVAGLVARARALQDRQAVPPEAVAFEATVADALDHYIDGLPSAGWTPARLALAALAYAETPGLPVSLWRVAVEALGGRITEEELTFFARTSAANFLVEGGAAATPTYRLFHQALNEALLGGRPDEHGILVHAWLPYARATGWGTAPEYLLRSLPQHAVRAGLVDDLLADDDYLLHAHLDRLLPAAETATTELGIARAHLLQRTPHALQATATERAALFSVVEKIDGLASNLRPSAEPPYRALWARTPRRLERTVLEGHSDAVYDVTAVPVDGRSMLASAGEDGTVRLWDPLTSQTEHVIVCHDDCVRGLIAVRAGPVTLLATASHDRTVKLWDPRNCQLVHTLTGHGDWVRNVCTLPLQDGRELLVSGSDDRTVRLWDPVGGTCVATLRGHTNWVTAVCRVGDLVASTGLDSTIRLWDPATGAAVTTFTGHSGWVTTLCAVGDLVASAGYDGTVRLWDRRYADAVAVFDVGAGPLTDLCTIEADGTLVLAVTAEDGIIRLWDMRTGAERPPIKGYANWIRAICDLPVGDRHFLATAGDDGAVRLWDPTTGRTESVMDGGLLGAVGALAEMPVAGETLVASTGGDGVTRLWEPGSGEERLALASHGTTVTDVAALVDDDVHLLAVSSEDRAVRLWDADTGELFKEFKQHHERVNAVCAVDGLLASGADDLIVRIRDVHQEPDRDLARPLLGHASWVTALTSVRHEDRHLLVSADKDGVIRLWEPRSGELLGERHAHDTVNALAPFPLGGREVLVSAGADRTIRLWSPEQPAPLGVLTGHKAPVTGVCAVQFGDRTLLASSSLDRTVRLWDPRTGRLVRVIPVHHQALACAYVGGALVVGLDRGILALATG